MAIDPNRGAFVKEEYRYVEANAPEVAEAQPQARTIKFETNLDMEAAQTLANEIRDEFARVPQGYAVKFEGVEVCKPSDFVGSPPTFACNFPSWPVELTDKLTVLSIVVDHNEWATTVVMRGPKK